MTSVKELEELLYVENIHTSHFEEWERRAENPLAKMIFRLAADKESNHVRWVKMLIGLARAREHGEDLGVTLDELKYWIEDEEGEGDSYQNIAESAKEPWIRIVLQQIGSDETTNSAMLRSLLETAST